jgi:hypothetical protein
VSIVDPSEYLRLQCNLGSTERQRGVKAASKASRAASGSFFAQAFEADDAGVLEFAECGGDGRVVDLAGSGFAASWDVGDLDFAYVRQCLSDQIDEVSLADLSVIQVEIHAQVRAVDRPDQGRSLRPAHEEDWLRR